jgi:hypothetical protein
MYRVRVELGGFAGAPGLATHYLDDAGGSAAQAATAVGQFWTDLQSILYDPVTWAVLPDVATITAGSGGLTAVTGVTSTSGSGTNTTEALPPSQMGLIRWHTAGVVSNRVLRGRTFVGPVTQDANDNGVLTSGAKADLQAAADAYIAAANSIPVVWHRPSPGGLDGSFSAITTASVWSEFAVLRGRRD